MTLPLFYQREVNRKGWFLFSSHFFWKGFSSCYKVPNKVGGSGAWSQEKLRWFRASGTSLIGPLHNPVTWCKITHASEQVAQWDFQNKGSCRWTGTSCIVFEVPLRNLLTSMCDFVSWDRIAQRAYTLAGRILCYCGGHKQVNILSGPLYTPHFSAGPPFSAKCFFGIAL